MSDMSELRERILRAAALVYARGGYRGTTTRRVAEEAQVNEITLFRHFGTKDALIRAALEQVDRSRPPAPLGEPSDPAAQLRHWAFSTFEHWYRHRALVSRVVGDMVEHPAIAPAVCEEPNDQHCQLASYFRRMQEHGLASRAVNPEVAAGLLMGAILSHATWRDHLPQAPPADQVIGEFVDLLLRAIGTGATPPRATRAPGHNSE